MQSRPRQSYIVGEKRIACMKSLRRLRFVADELDAGLLDAMKKLQVAAAVIKADDSAVDVFSDVVKTIGSLSI